MQNSQQNTNKSTEQLKHHTPQSTGIYLWDARTVHHIYRIKAKNLMTILTNVGKPFDKT